MRDRPSHNVQRLPTCGVTTDGATSTSERTACPQRPSCLRQILAPVRQGQSRAARQRQLSSYRTGILLPAQAIFYWNDVSSSRPSHAVRRLRVENGASSLYRRCANLRALTTSISITGIIELKLASSRRVEVQLSPLRLSLHPAAR